MTVKPKRRGQSGKTIEEVVAYAIGHRIRVYILAILNEGTFTAEELAEILDERPNNVAHHLKELLDAGSIELARTEKVRNADRHYYRAVEIPYYSDEEMNAMPPAQRQITYGLILQCMTAEALASLWAGRIRDDPRTWLGWRRCKVDKEGRDEIAEEQQRHWDRCYEIEAQAAERRTKSGEEPISLILGQMGFERERTLARPGGSSANVDQSAPLD